MFSLNNFGWVEWIEIAAIVVSFIDVLVAFIRRGIRKRGGEPDSSGMGNRVRGKAVQSSTGIDAQQGKTPATGRKVKVVPQQKETPMFKRKEKAQASEESVKKQRFGIEILKDKKFGKDSHTAEQKDDAKFHTQIRRRHIKENAEDETKKEEKKPVFEFIGSKDANADPVISDLSQQQSFDRVLRSDDDFLNDSFLQHLDNAPDDNQASNANSTFSFLDENDTKTLCRMQQSHLAKDLGIQGLELDPDSDFVDGYGERCSVDDYGFDTMHNIDAQVSAQQESVLSESGPNPATASPFIDDESVGSEKGLPEKLVLEKSEGSLAENSIKQQESLVEESLTEDSLAENSLAGNSFEKLENLGEISLENHDSLAVDSLEQQNSCEERNSLAEDRLTFPNLKFSMRMNLSPLEKRLPDRIPFQYSDDTAEVVFQSQSVKRPKQNKYGLVTLYNSHVYMDNRPKPWDLIFEVRVPFSRRVLVDLGVGVVVPKGYVLELVPGTCLQSKFGLRMTSPKIIERDEAAHPIIVEFEGTTDISYIAKNQSLVGCRVVQQQVDTCQGQ